ncbi:MAG: YdeI/OmpD-associated family protein [Candidatus Saccharimonas sp.]
MNEAAFPAGTVHTSVPIDLSKALAASSSARKLWLEITPLARNEWICWVTSPVQDATRARRVQVGISKLNSGMHRPCCWSGCPHRERNGK